MYVFFFFVALTLRANGVAGPGGALRASRHLMV